MRAALVMMLVMGFLSALRCAAAAADSTAHLGSVAVPKVTTAPPMDGTIDSPLWPGAATAHLGYDLRDHQPARQDTTVYMLSDGAFLYVAIEARQNIPIRATEHTNGVGLDTDDEFQIDLWPNGTSGFRYKFTSTPIGTHYQYSTENNSFEPEWWTAGRIVDGGYIVNMKIPFSVMHGTGQSDWRVQFIRYMPTTNDVFVWSYSPAQQDFNDVNYSGSADGLPRLSALRPKPRVGVYGLGDIASKSIGGDRVRTGADFSIPLMAGTAFVGTLYPDYSNVEVDQQTIAPTAFQRIFNEVRPFFTQGANFYSYPNGICSGCPGIIEFYTPNIPTPRDGYAIEGQRGLFSYASLHTVSSSRDDTGAALDYVTPNQQTALNFQGSQVDGLANGTLTHDIADGVTFTHNNLKNFIQFARFANDSGTNVLDPTQAKRYEAGFTWYEPDGANFNAVERKVGAFFNPVNGLVQHPDITGYNVNFFEPLNFATTARFTRLTFNGNLERYHDHTGALNQAGSGLQAALTTRTLFNFQASTGSAYVMFPGTPMTPVTQQGLQVGYNLNSSMPTFVAFNTGHFGPGRLNSWTRSTTFRSGARGALTLEADDTQQGTFGGNAYIEWLERVSYSYQSGPNQAFAFGVRRIIGAQPQLFTPPSADNAWNVSAAYHQKVPGGELYVVYGDASRFSTVPQFIVKYIRYLGADKGT